MGFAEILTIVFIVLKITGYISWAWWQVLLPEIIAGCVYVILFVIVLVFHHKNTKTISKSFNRFDRW